MINSRGAPHHDSQTCDSSHPSFNSCIICPPRNMSRNSLSANQELFKGDFLMSNNQQYKAMFQDDGNFVIYKWSPLWASNTECRQAYRVVLQEDTKLIIYTQAGQALWGNGCHTKTPSLRIRLTLTDDGHLVTYNDGEETWSS